MCKCGLPAWQFGQSSQCCTDRMLRAMPTAAALYLLANTQQNASEDLKREYRDKWRSSRSGNAGEPSPKQRAPA
jgi:hypothetical protein